MAGSYIIPSPWIPRRRGSTYGLFTPSVILNVQSDASLPYVCSDFHCAISHSAHGMFGKRQLCHIGGECGRVVDGVVVQPLFHDNLSL